MLSVCISIYNEGGKIKYTDLFGISLHTLGMSINKYLFVIVRFRLIKSMIGYPIEN
jgi:hypothetical protein